MSGIKSFRKIFDGTQSTRTLQTNIENAISGAIKSPLLDGRLVEGVVLASGSNKVSHKLGRTPKGFIAVKSSNASTIYTASEDESFLTVVASGAVTVSIWVF